MAKHLKVYHTFPDAMALARFAYNGLEDKAGVEYLAHPVRVADTVKRRGAPPYVQSAALLHDLFEDTCFTPRILADLGFHVDVIDLITLMTRGKHTGPCTVIDLCEGCMNYYIELGKEPGGVLIKDADMDDNSDPTRLAYLPSKVQRKQLLKYEHGREILHGVECQHVGMDLDAYLKAA